MVKKRRIPLLQATLTAICAVAPAHADYSDCRTCHYATTIDSTAPDFTSYFVAAGHHPVRVSYPIGADYNQPLTTLSGILFFDRNGNGVPDPDEIQIFSTTTTTTLTTTSSTTTKSRKSGSKTTTTTTTVTDTAWVIDCASCHTEHGTAPPDPTHPADYVRSSGGEQLLCITCHNL